MPFVTEAIAQRIEITGTAFTTRGIRQIQRLPGDPMDIETGVFGPVSACRQRRRPERVWYTEARPTGPGLAERIDEVLAFLDGGIAPSAPSPVTQAEIVTCSLFLEGQGRRLAEVGFRFERTAAVHAGEPRRLPLPPLATGVSLRPSPDSELGAWTQCWLDGFSVDQQEHDEIRAERAAWFSGPGYQRYAAVRDGRIVGIAGLFINGDTAMLDPSAVLPEARGQGIHAAFIAQRLTDAAEAGCDLAFVGTRLASASHRNQRRAGLELAYERLIFQRDR